MRKIKINFTKLSEFFTRHQFELIDSLMAGYKTANFKKDVVMRIVSFITALTLICASFAQASTDTNYYEARKTALQSQSAELKALEAQLAPAKQKALGTAANTALYTLLLGTTLEKDIRNLIQLGVKVTSGNGAGEDKFFLVVQGVLYGFITYGLGKQYATFYTDSSKLIQLTNKIKQKRKEIDQELALIASLQEI